MRHSNLLKKFVLATGVAVIGSVVAGNVATDRQASAAFPVFHNSAPAASLTAPSATAPKAKSGWKMPSLWTKSKPVSQDPRFNYQAGTTPPSTSQRIGTAITDNRVTNAVSGWITPNKPNAALPTTVPPVDNSLSLSTPIGKPTPQLLIAMAQAQEAQGDPQTASKLYQQALASGPVDAAILRELGHFEDRRGNLTQAEQYYQQAAAGAPEDTSVMNDLALCLARQNKLRPSAELLHKAIRLAPQKALYRNNMATVLMELGEQNEAMLHLLAVHPPAVAFYNMGHLLEKSGRGQAASGHYAEATRLDPTMQAAQVALARTAPAESPALQPNERMEVPQTAMVSQPLAAPVATETAWPSEPIATPRVQEPAFGPKLLPPAK